MTVSKSTYFVYQTPHGPITICASERGVTAIAFGETAFDGACRASEVTNLAANQLHEYLAGKRKVFSVPLDTRGTGFQEQVWAEVCMLEFGETATAADIAERIGKPGSHRSVGTAIRKNPIPILIPTHRVILPNASGKVAKVYAALRAMERSCGF